MTYTPHEPESTIDCGQFAYCEQQGRTWLIEDEEDELEEILNLFYARMAGIRFLVQRRLDIDRQIKKLLTKDEDEERRAIALDAYMKRPKYISYNDLQDKIFSDEDRCFNCRSSHKHIKDFGSYECTCTTGTDVFDIHVMDADDVEELIPKLEYASWGLVKKVMLHVIDEFSTYKEFYRCKRMFYREEHPDIHGVNEDSTARIILFGVLEDKLNDRIEQVHRRYNIT